MTKRIFIWVAHPKAGSLSSAIADAYQQGAEGAGAEVRRIELSDMSFNLDFEGYDPSAETKGGVLEPDLVAWQEAMSWAEHVFVVHPYWWGAMPSKAKAVLDRALLPGFGFKYHKKGIRWDQLLKGRTADAVITSDTPPFYDTWVSRKPGRRVLKNQVLGFCGIRVRKVVQFGSVKLAKPEKIKGWLKKSGDMGASAAT